MSRPPKRPCKTAKAAVHRLKLPLVLLDGEETPDARKCFFPAEEISKTFPKEVVQEVLECDCESCETDRASFDGNHAVEPYIEQVVQFATKLLALLVYIDHPLLIFGILRNTEDESFESSRSYTRDHLEKHCWPKFCRQEWASTVVSDFQSWKHHFFVPRLDGTYKTFDKEARLPFVRQEKIGKLEDGDIVSEGNFGTIFKFEIPDHYRTFKIPPRYQNASVSIKTKSKRFAVTALTTATDWRTNAIRTQRAT